MVNFGPMETVPERFRGRKLHVHNPTVTLMRTTAEENAALGARMAEVLGQARGPTVVLIPKGGVSGLDAPGKPFHDPEADSALFQALKGKLAGHPLVRIVERDEHINDPGFADAAARTLFGLLRDRDPALLGHAGMEIDWASAADLGDVVAFLATVGLPAEGVAEHIDGYLLVRGPSGRLLGCAGLERHDRVGLLRSLAVAPELRGYGLGSRLTSTLLNRAAGEGIDEVTLLTTSAPAREFFARRFGFEAADRGEYAGRLGGSAEWDLLCCESAVFMRRRLGDRAESGG
jgi:N-acetylglutamate synthase-like GNAT family acetyltransferase